MAARARDEDEFGAQMSYLSRWAITPAALVRGIGLAHFKGSGKVKRLEDLRGYDIVLTTYQVSITNNQISIYWDFIVWQTLAFEWPLPDDEVEAREKKRRKKIQDAWLEDDEEDRKKARRDRITRECPEVLF